MSFDYKYNYPQIARDSGFKLRKCRNGILDWQVIGSLEVEKIVREQQFEKIDGALSYLSEAPLAPALEISILDSSVGKYFFVSQLAIQYLIFCRKFLDESVKALRESFVKTEMDNENLRSLNQELSDEIVQLRKKVNQLEAINDIIFPCHICTKNFVSNDALNTHLNKKHSNIPNDIQLMNNDKTLINTIKLELEIKQLKERLNIAEKDIRETSENKKLSPRKCTTVSLSTQIETISVEVGTQCNLFEAKELDSSVDETYFKLFISELQEKLLTSEHWKEVQNFQNNNSLDYISKTLKEVNESLRAGYEQDFKNFKKIVEDSVSALKSSNEIVPTSTKELKSFLSSTVSDLMYQNSEKFNEILSKIETMYKEKLLYSEKETPSDEIKIENKIQNISLNPLITIEKPSNKKNYLANEKQLTNSPLAISEEVNSMKDSDAENIHNFKTSQTIINDMLKQELASYGIAAHKKILPTNEAANILSHLMEKRNNMQKMDPKFVKTRNKLLNFINNQIKKTPYNGNIHKYFFNSFKSQFISSENPVKNNGSNESDSFKEQLEKILCSPINKPSIYAPNYITDSIRPVPLPRKRVMFRRPIPTTEL